MLVGREERHSTRPRRRGIIGLPEEPPVRRIVAAFILLLAAASARGAEEHWYSLHLDGRKIGHMHTLREAGRDGRVMNEQALSLQLERSCAVLSIATRE